MSGKSPARLTAGTRRSVHILLFMLTALAGAAYAGVYKWTDAEGKVHYGDRPPAGAAPVDVPKGPQPAAPETNGQRRLRTQRLLDAWQEERRIEQERREQVRAQAAERERACLAARDRLEEYRRAMYLYERDQAGERRILSDPERAERTRELERRIAENCD